MLFSEERSDSDSDATDVLPSASKNSIFATSRASLDTTTFTRLLLAIPLISKLNVMVLLGSLVNSGVLNDRSLYLPADTPSVSPPLTSKYASVYAATVLLSFMALRATTGVPLPISTIDERYSVILVL